MNADPLLETFRRLSASEKIRLVQQLWDEIAEEASNLPLSDAQRRVLDERIADDDANPDDVELWSMVRDDLLRKL